MAKFDEVNRELDELATATTELTDAAQSAENLLDGLGGLLREHANDPAAITEIANRLDNTGASLGAAKVRLSDAILRNTPQDPNPGGGGTV